MRYNPVLHKTCRASRRGIAVMFALGILSLVIVAVLIFSQRAVIDRKVASAYSHYSEAKDLAQSAFGRALLQLKKNAAFGTGFYSGLAGDNDYDWLWKLDPEKHILQRDGSCPVRWQYVRDSRGHIIGRYAYIIVGEKRLNLNAILDHSLCSAGTSCDGGAGCLRTQRLGNTAVELQFDPDKFSNVKLAGENLCAEKLQAVTSGGKIRQYNSPEDLLTSGLSVSGSWASALNRVNSLFTVSRASSLDESDAWFGGDVNSNGVKDKNEYYQRFLLNKTETQWDAIAEKSGDGDSAVNEILNPSGSGSAVAFYESGVPKASNTAGIPWLNNWSENSGNWPDNATKGKQIAANLINYCASGDKPVVSNQTPLVTSEDKPAWRIPASGQPPYSASNSDNLVPTYTGNKRTWYLNECVALLEIEVQKGAAKTHDVKNGSGVKVGEWFSFGDGSSKNKLLIRLYVLPELINMFGSDVLDGTYSVEGYLDYEFQFAQNMSSSATGDTTAPYFTNTPGTSYGSYSEFNGSSQHQTLARKPSSTSCYSTSETSTTYYQTFKISKSGTAYVAQREVEVPGNFGWSTNSPSQADIESLGLFKVKNIKIKNFRLMVRRAKTGLKELVDYAYLPDISVDDEQVLAADPAASPALKKDIVVSDPRHNLHQDDWVTYDLAGKNSDGSWGTLGKVNSMSVAPTGASWSAENGWDKDKETATNPANKSISTAYIRHAPMQSLWELGAIHRAAPWQTINLKKPGSCSDTLTTNLTAAGGGAYGKGDFRILDQVTIQGSKTSYVPVGLFGRINLYAPNTGIRKFTFDSLFRGMPWATDGDYARTTTAALDGTAAQRLADGLGKAFDMSDTDHRVLYRRSDIYQTGSGHTDFWNLIEKDPRNGTTDLNKDAEQEQLMGRIIGLTTVNSAPDSATVIVLAQSIQDLGGGAVVYRTWNTDSSKKKQEAGYYFYKESSGASADPEDPGFFSTPTLPGDEITAHYGRYDNGADRITGETKMVARLLYDHVAGKWKIIQVKYED